MIKNFKDRDTAKLFNRDRNTKIPPQIQRVALRKLVMIHGAKELRDLKVPPGNHLEPLKNDRIGQHGIRINAQYRICFKWDHGDAYQVEITDYH